MEHPVHNLIIVMQGPDGRMTMVNMTVPEPGAKKLAGHISSLAPSSHPQAVLSALRQGFNEIDTIVVNEPTPPIPVEAPEGKPLDQVYRDDLIDIAEGAKVVVLHEGDPVVISAEDAADIDAGEKHLYRDIETGQITVKDGDGKAKDIPPQTDGSSAGEKHTEGNPN